MPTSSRPIDSARTPGDRRHRAGAVETTWAPLRLGALLLALATLWRGLPAAGPQVFSDLAVETPSLDSPVAGGFALGEDFVFGLRGAQRVSGSSLPDAPAIDLIAPTLGSVHFLGRTNDGTYFAIEQPGQAFRYELWRTDGTRFGSEFLLRFYSIQPPSGLALGDRLIFAAWIDEGSLRTHMEPWTTDGTPEGTQRLGDISPGFRASVNYNPSFGFPTFFEFQGAVYFVAYNSTVEMQQLWKTDGTPEGTAFVADLTGSTIDDVVTSFTALGDDFFFVVANVMWRSDGTTEGTARFEYQFDGQMSSRAGRDLGVLGDRLIFNNADGVNGPMVLASDGTSAETSPLFRASIVLTMRRLGARQLVFGTIFLPGTGFVNAVWATDGTPGGSERFFESAVGLGQIETLAFGNKVLFTIGATELWETDGTALGTSMLETFDEVEFLGATPSWLFLTVDDAAHGKEPWFSDGSQGGARLLRDFTRHNDSQIDAVTPIDDRLYFAAADGANGVEPWYYDQSDDNFAMVGEFTGDDRDSHPRRFTRVGTEIAFVALTGQPPTAVRNAQLVAFDETTSTSRVVANYAVPASYLARPPVLLPAANRFFYEDGVFTLAISSTARLRSIALDGQGLGTTHASGLSSTSTFPLLNALVHNGKLYTTFTNSQNSVNFQFVDVSGSVPGPTLGPSGIVAAGLAVYNDQIFFGGYDESGESIGLWTSDGTTTGTVLAAELPPDGMLYPQDLVALTSGLYFTAGTDLSTQEPWVSDGTTSGTLALGDLYPGATGSNPRDFSQVEGIVYFVTTHPTLGEELWRTDGTPEGTRPALDVAPGAASSDIREITPLGSDGAFAFVATRDDVGRELWIAGGDPLQARPVADLEPGFAFSAPDNLRLFGDNLIFAAFTSATGRELWRIPIAELLALIPEPSSALVAR